MPRVDALLMDLDGTLVDSQEDIAAAANHLREVVGLEPMPVAEVAAMIGDGLPMLVRRLLADQPGMDLEESIALFRSWYGDHSLDATRPYEGIPEALEALAHVPKVVVTNKPARYAAPILDGLDLSRHFLGLVGGDTCPTKKPDPAPVRLGLEMAGLEGEGPAAIVGDGDADIAAGRAAGIVTCAVEWGIGDREKLFAQTPDLVARTPADLVRLFAS